MKQWRFEVFSRPATSGAGSDDAGGRDVLGDIKELGIDTVQQVQSARVFLVEGDFDEVFAKRIGGELLADPVCENFYIGKSTAPAGLAKATIIEIHLKSGVTDPVAESVMTAIGDMGKSCQTVRTARKYILFGEINDKQLKKIVRRLSNDCIEVVVIGTNAEPPSPHLGQYELELKTVDITKLGEQQLVELSKKMDLFLNAVEMKTIQDYFKSLGREPTDIELEALAQTWSEHCVHKTLKSSVDFDFDGEKIHFDNLIKETVFGATKQLNKEWCISVFKDNAGVIEFDDTDAICFKVETHNHPSALDPYGGAATGIGGVLRDPMGTGLGAKPIANTDIFCFAEPDKSFDEIPRGVLHPKRIAKGVVAGVRDYGNRMGIPTVNGAIFFDDRYLGNPLVFCGNIGIMPRDKCFGKVSGGELVMVVGGRTGRDGIHGATFSSGALTGEHETVFSHAVQIGNAITEKKTLDTLLRAREQGLYSAITDCGAGGLSSAVGEMGAELGAEVELEKVPLKYAGLSYTEIWISEAQERMVIAVKPEELEKISKIFADENVEATVIGKFTNDKKLTLKYQGTQVGQLDMDFLHNGLPKYSRKANWSSKKLSEPALEAKENYNDDLLKVFSTYNIASKEWVIRQYDHEVQGGSVVKPLGGIANDGPNDAAVVQPKFDSDKGIAIGCGMNPLYGDIDPYWMTLAGIDEAIRNVICVGARPDRIALLDNFCWADCKKEETLGSLVRAAQACFDGAVAFGTPFISGKDSLNNNFICDDGKEISIPATLLISTMGIVDDVKKCVTADLKSAGNLLFIVGLTKNELGGSHYYKIKNQLGANVPKTDLRTAKLTAEKIHKAIDAEFVASCHDCSEGGLAVAISEMAFAGGLGVLVDLQGLPKTDDCTRLDAQLFSESCSRYIVEVRPEKFNDFAKLMLGVPFGQIGQVTEDKNLIIKSSLGKTVINASIGDLKDAWQRPLKW
ncbi:MAG: phosphoribosylformylglycinamidine synthase subunit PurL [Planctomycetes bacterium]|nr:phosphoribosylformylglycinamidine synthase subunit PurL [Planctomycetota bacterium]MBU2457643.1 phosphoribosylformylglycinamidine synthase subunit PurL [Planctomycetota bacterium]